MRNVTYFIYVICTCFLEFLLLLDFEVPHFRLDLAALLQQLLLFAAELVHNVLVKRRM